MFLFPVDERAIGKIIKRYSEYDTSEKGTDGIAKVDVDRIPEFNGHAMVSLISEYHMDKETQRLFPQNFIYFIATLSSKSTLEHKRDRKLLR